MDNEMTDSEWDEMTPAERRQYLEALRAEWEQS